MRLNRRGVTLVELIFAMGLGLAILAVGYKAYFGVSRADDYESRRELMTITTQNLMGRIKQDVRASSSATVSGGSLVVQANARRIVYSNARDGSGVERVAAGGRGVFKGVRAEFLAAGGGSRAIGIRLRSESTVHRRRIRIDLASFVSPRN